MLSTAKERPVKTRYIKLQLTDDDARAFDRLIQLAADYENLSPLESAEYDDLSAEILAPENLGLVPEDNSIVCWLPVDGTVPPEVGKTYMVASRYGYTMLGIHYTDTIVRDQDLCYWGYNGGVFPEGEITHYAELPVKR